MKTYRFKINGKPYEVSVEGIQGQTASVTVNGTAYQVEMDQAPAAPVAAAPAAPAPASPTVAAAPAAPAPAPSGAGCQIVSPLPGVVIEISVREGQAVKAGQKVAVIEAMKMENEIAAEADGTVSAILVSKGDSVLEGAPLMTLA